MKRFLSVLSLGMALAVSAHAELTHHEAESIRSMYRGLDYVNTDFQRMDINEQADFIFSGLQGHEFRPSHEEILSVIKEEKELKKNEESAQEKETNQYVEHVYDLLNRSDPAFKFRNTNAKVEDVYDFFKRVKPDSNVSRDRVNQIILSLEKKNTPDEVKIKDERKQPFQGQAPISHQKDRFGVLGSSSQVAPIPDAQGLGG